ncbi:MAG: septum formation initiator family protein [Holosporales bacterium]|jgi:cell division protein FtsB|nr:septum formation initiator family protein [Holosporales bacterium]
MWERFSKFITSLLAIVCVGYFTYHLIQGDRGLLAWIQLEKKRAEATRYLAEIKEKNHAHCRKILHLQNRSLDLDLLGEQAYFLGLAHPGDIIILTPEYTFSKEE